MKTVYGDALPTVSYHKVSYDRCLGDNVSAYSEAHPEVPFHEVIDIIRAKADQDYLNQVAAFCTKAPSSAIQQPVNLGKQRMVMADQENVAPTKKANGDKQIIYLDRNNTPDIWADIINTI